MHTYIYIHIYKYTKIYIYALTYINKLWVEYLSMARETWVQSQVKSYQRLKKMVLDIFLFDTQCYKAGIKDKMEKSR